MKILARMLGKHWEKSYYDAVAKLNNWEEHVRWFSPTFPVLCDISDRVKAGKTEMMLSRSELVEQHGKMGISLPELIVLNLALRKAMIVHNAWSDYQLNAGRYIPFYFNWEVQYLFNHRHDQICKERIPVLEIHTASEQVKTIVEETIERLYHAKDLSFRTYEQVHYKVINDHVGKTDTTFSVQEHSFKQPIHQLYIKG